MTISFPILNDMIDIPSSRILSLTAKNVYFMFYKGGIQKKNKGKETLSGELYTDNFVLGIIIGLVLSRAIKSDSTRTARPEILPTATRNIAKTDRTPSCSSRFDDCFVLLL
jgi:hypothetical protein